MKRPKNQIGTYTTSKAISKINHNTKKNLVYYWKNNRNESISLYKICPNKFKNLNLHSTIFNFKKPGHNPCISIKGAKQNHGKNLPVPLPLKPTNGYLQCNKYQTTPYAYITRPWESLLYGVAQQSSSYSAKVRH